MCYRCSLCPAVVPPGLPRLVHVIKRIVSTHPMRTVLSSGLVVENRIKTKPREEIAAELPVCVDCHLLLASGVSMQDVKRRRGSEVIPSAPPLRIVAKPQTQPPVRATAPPAPAADSIGAKVADKVVRQWRKKNAI